MWALLEPSTRFGLFRAARCAWWATTITACSAGSSTPAPRVGAASTAEPAIHVVSQSDTRGCDCARRLNAATLEQARDHALKRLEELRQGDRDANTYVNVPPNTTVLNTLPCWDTPRGAWAVVSRHAALCPVKDDVDAVADTRTEVPQWVAVAHGALTYIDSATCRVTQSNVDWRLPLAYELDSSFGTDGVPCSTHSEAPETDAPVFYDFDADGEPELWLSRRYPFSDGMGPDTHLLTFDGVKVRSYVPTDVHYRKLEDVDHDGRPDLIWSFDVDLLDDCSDHGHEPETPPFLAHATADGRFVTDDAVAKGYAQNWCPEPPREIDSIASVLCARMYGLSAAVILQELEPIGPTDCESNTIPHPLSAMAPPLRDAARVELPFVLP